MRIIPIMGLVWQLTPFSKENRFSKIRFEITSLKFQTGIEMQQSSNSNLDSMSFQKTNMKKYWLYSKFMIRIEVDRHLRRGNGSVSPVSHSALYNVHLVALDRTKR